MLVADSSLTGLYLLLAMIILVLFLVIDLLVGDKLTGWLGRLRRR